MDRCKGGGIEVENLEKKPDALSVDVVTNSIRGEKMKEN